MSTVQTPEARNPFDSSREFSTEAIAIMRAMSSHRKTVGEKASSPSEILHVVRSLGYRQPAQQNYSLEQQEFRFTRAMAKWQQENNVPFPTCENLVAVLDAMGYEKPLAPRPDESAGLPIDRRRQEPDSRESPDERRSSTDLSKQETLDLTPDEHAVLDALKDLRQRTGRDFASSEELLSILWDLGYRPLDSNGVPATWLEEEERCQTQIQFTHAIEAMTSTNDDGFLTCRSLLSIVDDIGMTKLS